MADAIFEVTAPKDFFNQDIEATLRRALHRRANDLGAMENKLIEDRTPVDQGALLNSETFTTDPNPDDEELVFLFADPQEQIDVHNREYDVYQEGGALGLATYTNAPHEMFAQVETTDLPVIQAWGEAALQEGCDEITAGTGIPK
jgi:hypothetical protein